MTDVMGAQLDLARRWLSALKCEIEIMPADPSVQRTFLALGVKRGATRFLVFETDSNVLVVTALLQTGHDVRQITANLSEGAQEKMLDLLKNTLVSDPLTGYDILPLDAVSVGKVDAIRFERLLKIEDTAVSFTQFEDAVQSIVSACVRVTVLFQAAFRQPAAGRTKPESGANKRPIAREGVG
jgi:hypothetical protein